jgi:hypothetical protein
LNTRFSLFINKFLLFLSKIIGLNANENHLSLNSLFSSTSSFICFSRVSFCLASSLQRLSISFSLSRDVIGRRLTITDFFSFDILEKRNLFMFRIFNRYFIYRLTARAAETGRLTIDGPTDALIGS